MKRNDAEGGLTLRGATGMAMEGKKGKTVKIAHFPGWSWKGSSDQSHVQMAWIVRIRCARP